MNPFFNWLKDSGTQAAELFITACAAIGALLLTWHFGRKSLTQKDLQPVVSHTAATSEKLDDVETHLAAMKDDIKRVEGNTAESSGHLDGVRGHLQTINQTAAHQAERDAAMEKAQSVSIKVWGESHATELLNVHLAPRDPDVVLTRIGLYNEHGSCFGSIDCARESDAQFGAPLTREQFGRWMQGGTYESVMRVRARLRVYMTFNDREGYRDISVSLFSGQLTRGNTTGPVNTVDGKV